MGHRAHARGHRRGAGPRRSRARSVKFPARRAAPARRLAKFPGARARWQGPSGAAGPAPLLPRDRRLPAGAKEAATPRKSPEPGSPKTSRLDRGAAASLTSPGWGSASRGLCGVSVVEDPGARGRERPRAAIMALAFKNPVLGDARVGAAPWPALEHPVGPHASSTTHPREFFATRTFPRRAPRQGLCPAGLSQLP